MIESERGGGAEGGWDEAGERELLLLGLLRSQEMHGYQLSEFLEAHLGLFFDIKRATAYNLLGKMEERGWVSAREEREGNRPPKRVYSVTAEGEAVFQHLLRAALPEYEGATFPGNVPILFMDALPPDRLAELLARRKEKIHQRIGELRGHSDHARHPLFDHQMLILGAELEWVEGLIEGLGPK